MAGRPSLWSASSNKHPSHASRCLPSEVGRQPCGSASGSTHPSPLANKRLVTDGAYATSGENPSELYRVKTSQHAFVEVSKITSSR